MDASSAQVLEYAPPAAPRLRRALSHPAPWLILILLLAAALRWYRIDHQSFWLDEFLAAENSTGRGQLHVAFPVDQFIDPAPALTSAQRAPGFWRIWTSLKTETHPPLHFMLLNPWRAVFGEGDLATRSFSAFFSLIAILAAFDVARLLHGRSVALWIALLMAVAGAQIQYAQEARNYTLALTLMLAAADALVRIEKLGVNRARIGSLFICVLALPLTHYLATGVAAALFAYALIRLRGRARNLAVAAFIAAGAVYIIIWGPFLLEQSRGFAVEHSWQQQAAGSTTAGHLMLTLRRLAILPLRYFTEPMKNSMLIGQLAAVMFILPLMLLPRRRDLLLWILLMAGAILPVVIADLLRPASTLAVLRYTFLASVPVYALAAAMLWHLRGFLAHAVPLVLAISCVLAIEEPYATAKADTRELARFVAQHVAADDIVVFFTDAAPRERWLSTSMYLGISHYKPPPCPVLFATAPLSPANAARAAAARRIWLISPTIGIPNDQLFPGSERTSEAFFPWVGTMASVRLK